MEADHYLTQSAEENIKPRGSSRDKTTTTIKKRKPEICQKNKMLWRKVTKAYMIR
jgi:hypothetical protein